MTGHRLTLIAAVCACALFLLAAPAPALAQEDPATNTSEPTVPEESEPQESEQVTDQLGDLTIHSYEYDNDDKQMEIVATWNGSTPETVTLTEMIELDSEGSTAISFKTVRLLPNERTEITIGAEQRSSGTAAVLLTTPQSVENNEALVLQAGDPNIWPSIGLDSALFASGLSALGSAALVFVFVLRRKHDEDNGVNKIA